MTTESQPYPARLEIDYQEKLDRFTTFFRIIWIIPIAIIAALISASSTDTIKIVSETGELLEQFSTSGGGITGGLFVATMLMLVFRHKYPRWWFDFAREFLRFGARVGAYLALLTDTYPSTDEEQSVHLEIDYPNATGLNRFLPLVKWLLLIPHYIVLAFLFVGAVFAVLFSWFAILITGRYPRGLFNYIVGVGRWALRVNAYGFLLITDDYPPFSLK